MKNKNIIIGSLVVVALVGLYFLFSNNAPEAVAQQPVQQEEVQAQPAQPIAQAETPAQVEEPKTERHESLGASSSGLGR